ncbi:SH3 domain-containing protein [Roseibium sp. M-1]
MIFGFCLKRMAPVLGTLALFPLGLSASEAAEPERYLCADGNLVYNVVTTRQADQVSLIGPIRRNAPDQAPSVFLSQVPSQNGVRYESGNVRFFGKSARYLQVGTGLLECQVQANTRPEPSPDRPRPDRDGSREVNMQGQSLGGSLRAGPGINFTRTGSLPAGMPLTILRRTPEIMNGYSWFEIRAANGLSGYQWGGIMCSEDRDIRGVLSVCEQRRPGPDRDNRPQGPRADAVDAPGQSLGGVLRTGPGTDYARTGSLQEGTPLTIVRRTRQYMNGYDWFEVRTSDGQSGYQWGGIMCSVGTQIEGIFQACPGRQPGYDDRRGERGRPDPDRRGNYAARITVTNQTGAPVDLVSVPDYGPVQRTARLAPFETVTVDTTLGRRFQFVRGNAIYSEFTVDQSQGQSVVFRN